MGIAADIASFPSVGVKRAGLDPLQQAQLELQAQRQLQQFKLEQSRVDIEAQRVRDEGARALVDTVTGGSGIPAEAPEPVDFGSIIRSFSDALQPATSAGFAAGGADAGESPSFQATTFGPLGLADPTTEMLLLLGGGLVLFAVLLKRKR